MSVAKKVEYLKGLAEGLGVDDSSKEGKLLLAIIGVLDDMSDSIGEMVEYVNELTDQVDAIDEDLDSLEDDFYDDDDDDCDCCEFDSDYYDVECPQCSQEFTIDEETLLDGEVVCPSCGEKLEFELECDCDDDHCDCNADSE